MTSDRDHFADAVLGFLSSREEGAGAVTITRELPLIEEDVMDSLLLFELVAYLEDLTGQSVPFEELTPENFATVDAIAGLAARLRPAGAAD